MEATMNSALAVDMKPKAAHVGLDERALNVVLSLSAWGGQRIDRKITAEVLAERQADSDAGRFEKYLVPPKALDPVKRAQSAARRRHYSLTLPWGNEGVRILASAAFFDYATAMEEERGKCETEHRTFAQNYQRYIDEAPRRLGTKLFNAADFPPVATISSYFAFKLRMLPVPNTSDFRVDLDEEFQEQVRKSIEETFTERFSDAQDALWERLTDAVRHFAETMADEKKAFKDSTVDKLGELAVLAPKLTLTQDPTLEALCAEIAAIPGRAAPSDFRENPLLRREAAVRAQVVVRKLAEARKRSA